MKIGPVVAYWLGIAGQRPPGEGEDTMKLSRKSKIQDREPLIAVAPTEVVATRGRWSTAFLMAASAVLGATAVAFWNRRTIANMRVQILAEGAKPQRSFSTEEEIF